MVWSINENAIQLVSPPLVRRLRVLPLGKDTSGVVRLLTDQGLTEVERIDKEALLSFQLGQPAILETLEMHPEVTAQAFSHEFDRVYGIAFPTLLTRSAMPLLLTVLVVGRDSSLRRTLVGKLRSGGFDVVEASGIRIALAFLNGCSTDVGRILVCGKVFGDTDTTIERLRSAAPSASIEIIDSVEATPPTTSECDHVVVGNSRLLGL
jgi:hypothetical protein